MSIEAHEQRCIVWVNRQITTQYSPKLTHFGLFHIAQSGAVASSPLSDFQLPEGEITVQTIVNDIMTTAQWDADGLGGVQRYALLAMAKKTKLGARCVFRMDGADQTDGMHTEPANATGLTTAAMRHTEAIFKASVLTWAQSSQAQNRLIDKLTLQVSKQQDAHLKMLEMQERMLNEEAERKLEERKAEMIQDAAQEGIGMLKAYAPALISGFAKKQNIALPPRSQELSPLEGAVKNFMASITPEQFAELQNTLSHEQIIMVTTLWEASKNQSERVGETEPDPVEDIPPEGLKVE